jgi:hypothetical protein
MILRKITLPIDSDKMVFLIKGDISRQYHLRHLHFVKVLKL